MSTAASKIMASRNGTGHSADSNGHAARPSSKPRLLLSMGILKQITDHADLISIHPEALALLAPTAGNMEHVEKAREAGQTEFILVRFHKDAEHKDVVKVVDLVSDARQKPRPSNGKIQGLVDKGYMLIPEDSTVRALNTFIPRQLLKPAAKALTAAG